MNVLMQKFSGGGVAEKQASLREILYSTPTNQSKFRSGRTQSFHDLIIKQNLIQVYRGTTRNGVIQTKRLHWNSAERKINMISIQSERLKYLWIESPEAKCFNSTNSTVLILWRAQTSKPKHEIYTLHFLFNNNHLRSHVAHFLAVTVRNISKGLKSTSRMWESVVIGPRKLWLVS